MTCGGARRRQPMDEVKKKVLLDVFVSPWTLLPTVTGLSAWMLSWGAGGNTTLNLIGLAGVLIGAGVQATRLVFGIEDLTERAHGYVTEKQRAEWDAKLDGLAAKLRQDEDWRTEESLKRLRKLHAAFQEEPPAAAAVTIREKVDRLFHASVAQLEKSYDLWEKAKRIPGDAGKPLLDQRREAVNEVVLTVNHLAKTVEQYHAFQSKDSDDDLARLREELDATIEVARKAESRIDELDASPAYDEADYET